MTPCQFPEQRESKCLRKAVTIPPLNIHRSSLPNLQVFLDEEDMIGGKISSECSFLVMSLSHALMLNLWIINRESYHIKDSVLLLFRPIYQPSNK